MRHPGALGHVKYEDHTRFLRLERMRNADGEEPIVSVAAFRLHGFGIINSVCDGHPGLV